MGVVCKATCFRPKRLRPAPPVLLYFFSFLSFSARRFVLRACAQRNPGFNFFCLPTISPTLPVSHSLPQQIVEGDSIVCLALLPLAVTHVTACLTLLAPGCFQTPFLTFSKYSHRIRPRNRMLPSFRLTAGIMHAPRSSLVTPRNLPSKGEGGSETFKGYAARRIRLSL